jgi:hypothetical protein
MSKRKAYAVSEAAYLELLAERVAATLAPIYRARGWVWGDKIPDEWRLRDTTLSLIETVLSNDFAATGTGRITVLRDDDGDDSVMLTVLLEVAQVTLEASK